MLSEKRPSSALATRRSILQHQYTTPSPGRQTRTQFSTTCLGDNRLHTMGVRHAKCVVDIGRDRNAAVAYWRKPSYGKGCTTTRRPRTAQSDTDAESRAGTRKETSLMKHAPTGAQQTEALYVVHVSKWWGCKRCNGQSGEADALLSVPLKTTSVVLPNGKTEHVTGAHQHIRFHNPAPISKVATDNTLSDDGRGVVLAVSPGRSVEGGTPIRGATSPTSSHVSSANKRTDSKGISGGPKKLHRHRTAILTAADVLADAAATHFSSDRRHRAADPSLVDEEELLQEFGWLNGRPWELLHNSSR